MAVVPESPKSSPEIKPTETDLPEALKEELKHINQFPSHFQAEGLARSRRARVTGHHLKVRKS